LKRKIAEMIEEEDDDSEDDDCYAKAQRVAAGLEISVEHNECRDIWIIRIE